MNSHQNLSTYLVRPDLTPKRNRQWAGFRTQIFDITRSHPRVISRTLLALLIWSTFFAGIRYMTNPGSLSSPTAYSSNGVASLAQASSINKTTPVVLTRAAPALAAAPAVATAAAALPSSPTAPANAPYANSYVRGQCTWYVASRRQIPAGWGNAKSWYYNAVASGWRVGTAPSVGAVAWTSAGWAGHVALVEQVSGDGKSVYVSEMNYRGPYIKDFRWVSTSSFKYIY